MIDVTHHNNRIIKHFAVTGTGWSVGMATAGTREELALRTCCVLLLREEALGGGWCSRGAFSLYGRGVCG